MKLGNLNSKIDIYKIDKESAKRDRIDMIYDKKSYKIDHIGKIQANVIELQKFETDEIYQIENTATIHPG